VNEYIFCASSLSAPSADSNEAILPEYYSLTR